MSSTLIQTAIMMLEALPEPAQEQVVEHLREYITELEEERKWEASFRRTQPQLAAAARRAGEQIAQGAAEPLDMGKL